MQLFNNNVIRLYKEGDQYILSHAWIFDTAVLTDTCFDQVNKYIIETGVKSKYDKTSPIVLEDCNTLVYPSGAVFKANGKPRAVFKRKGGNRYYVRLPKRRDGLLDGSRTEKSVAKLIAETFIPNIFGFKYVIFKDDDTSNLHYSNLEWAPFSSDKQRVLVYNKWVKAKMTDAVREAGDGMREEGEPRKRIPKEELIEEIRELTSEKYMDGFWKKRYLDINIPNGLYEYLMEGVINAARRQ